MKVTKDAHPDAAPPAWPERFPKDGHVTCPNCESSFQFESPLEFTVRHHPPKGKSTAKKVPETGLYVAADASGTVPFDPEGKQFIVEFVCPVCGTIQRAEVD